MTPGKFRERSIATVEAMQWDGSEKSQREIVDWANGRVEGNYDGHLAVNTPHGGMRADVDDWIVRNVRGEFYPCSPTLFEMIYEPDKN